MARYFAFRVTGIRKVIGSASYFSGKQMVITAE
jgi:hypothetical protein